MMAFKRAMAGAILAAVTLAGGHALAQGGVQVDLSGTGAWRPTGFCTLSVACAGQTLSFNIDVGHGLTNKVYTYSNGLTSIGHELTAPPVPLDPDGNPIPFPTYTLADFAGQDYFSPAFYGASSTFGPNIVTTHSFPNLDLVVQGATAVRGSSSGFPTYIEFILTPIAGTHQGAFQLVFNYGDNGVRSSPIFDQEAAYDFGTGHTAEAFVGRALPTLQFDLGSTPLDSGGGDAGGGVPEPAVWALIISGFAGVGAALRSRRRHEVLARRSSLASRGCATHLQSGATFSRSDMGRQAG